MKQTRMHIHPNMVKHVQTISSYTNIAGTRAKSLLVFVQYSVCRANEKADAAAMPKFCLGLRTQMPTPLYSIITSIHLQIGNYLTREARVTTS